jgi:hypothetical protein
MAFKQRYKIDFSRNLPAEGNRLVISVAERSVLARLLHKIDGAIEQGYEILM